MGLREEALKQRLAKSRVVKLPSSGVEVRLAGSISGRRGFSAADGAKDQIGRLQEGLLGYCLADTGEPAFADAAALDNFLDVLDLEDTAFLITELGKSGKKLEVKLKKGNFKGSRPGA